MRWSSPRLLLRARTTVITPSTRGARAAVGGPAGTDLNLILAIASLWGPEVLKRVRFVESSQPEHPSRFASLLGLRG